MVCHIDFCPKQTQRDDTQQRICAEINQLLLRGFIETCHLVKAAFSKDLKIHGVMGFCEGRL